VQINFQKVSPQPLCVEGPALPVAHLLSSRTLGLLPHPRCDLLLGVSLLYFFVKVTFIY